MSARLEVALTATYQGKPLAVINRLPGDGAELTPAQCRMLAQALLRIADDAEGRKLTHRGKPAPIERRVYPLEE